MTGLVKRFGEAEVLRGIDLEIPAGKVSCLIGPSGSGKSTLLRCMAFLEEASAGTILVNGDPLGFAAGTGWPARCDCPRPASGPSDPGSAWCSSSSTSGRI